MTTAEIRNEFEHKYGKKITEYLVEMHHQRIERNDGNYLGENPAYLIGLLLNADIYLWDRVEEIENENQRRIRS